MLDSDLPVRFGSVLATSFQLLGIMAVAIAITPRLILLITPVTIVYVMYQRYFLSSSRELTRLEAITKSPIIHHFAETLAGAVSIRAFRQEERFAGENLQRIDDNLRANFHNLAANEWLGLRLELIAAFILTVTAMLLTAPAQHAINPGMVGISLSYGLTLSTCVCFLVLSTCQLENKMVSVERIKQYTVIPSEASPIVQECRPPPDWPSEGSIEFQQLQVRYHLLSPLVLKGVTCSIGGGEKVGVVGRTGSGKSTLIQSLFRLVEPCGGRIIIDTIDISSIGLKDLRSKLAIIPQEATMFEGTVRSNLDPLGVHTDTEMWQALEKCTLADLIRKKDEKLDSAVTEYGGNWSVGQRQLFSLGRALLAQCKILVLDEATASIDSATDAVIQRVIRKEFSECTIISIAHRIPTVIDSDRVMVLNNGVVVEYGAPSRLLEDKGSCFASMVHEYSSRSSSVADLTFMVRNQSPREESFCHSPSLNSRSSSSHKPSGASSSGSNWMDTTPCVP
ncbi:hypothetical protein CBR_g34650 [Chara braunii]|uniref:ABC transporter domain-containing protein n=1 Tax=Chara braunii TaxID=69332 RepID=A0A388LJB8_CHABU|nr:hypothetical protein CBR_g34650 [Chara braunii]|eukprot:GBG82367.1 hypothetical protein CBR_g34650 [Chara braunii]